MFAGAVIFNQDISSWDTSNVANMDAMFEGAARFNQPLGTWDTSAVTTMRGMFNGAATFDQDLSGWDVSGTEGTGLEYVFRGAAAFDSDLSGWDIADDTSFVGMFEGAASFTNGGEPLAWDDSTSQVVDMSNMFAGAAAFDQDVAGWDTGPRPDACRGGDGGPAPRPRGGVGAGPRVARVRDRRRDDPRGDAPGVGSRGGHSRRAQRGEQGDIDP